MSSTHRFRRGCAGMFGVTLLLAGAFWLSRGIGLNGGTSFESENGRACSLAARENSLGAGERVPIRRKLPAMQRKIESNKWFVRQRTYPFGAIPMDAEIKALQDMRSRMIPDLRQMYLAKGAKLPWRGQSLTWTFRGPGNVGGRLRGLVVDPNNINVMYAGSVSGGVWKTTNGGASWYPTMDNEITLNVTALAMKPDDPNTLYAGTGEGFFNADALPGRGVLKSTDGGQTWTRYHVANGLNTSFITELAISPANPSVIYASGRRSYSAINASAESTPDIGINAIFKSTSEGQSWADITTGKGIDHDPSRTFDNIPTDIEVSPLSADTIFATFGLYYYGGIWRSVDGGQSWARLTNGLPDPYTQNNGYGRIELAMSPSHPNVLYASFSYVQKSGDTSDLPPGGLLGIWKTVDGGKGWTKVTTATSTASRNILLNLKTALGQQGDYDNALRVHPSDPNTVFLGGLDIYKSTNGGGSWTQVSLWVPNTPGFPYAHADQHVFTFHTATNPPTLFAGNDGGVFKTTNLGSSWASLNSQLGVTQFYFFDLHPTNANIMLGGSQDNGSPMLINGGIDDWGDITGGDGGPGYFDYEDPSTIYASVYELNMYRLYNFNYTTGNSNFEEIGYTNGANGITKADQDSAAFFAPYEISPDEPSVLVLGTYRVLKTTNKGDSWTPISSSLSPGAAVTTVAIAPGTDNIVWAATDDARVFKTENNGVQWSEVTRANLPDRFVSDIEFHPASPGTAYLAYSGYTTAQYGKSVHVFKSINAGNDWLDITSNLPDVPVNTIQGHPTDPSTLFIGTDIGVFLSDDGGATWQPANNGFPATQVVAIRLNLTTDRIVAATHGRGVFEAPLSTLGVPVASLPPRSPVLYQNYPNPFNPSTTIAYELPQPATVSLKIFDVLGREVAVILHEIEQPAGLHKVDFTATGLASGVYFARLSVGGRLVQSKKMVLAR